MTNVTLIVWDWLGNLATLSLGKKVFLSKMQQSHLQNEDTKMVCWCNSIRFLFIENNKSFVSTWNLFFYQPSFSFYKSCMNWKKFIASNLLENREKPRDLIPPTRFSDCFKRQTQRQNEVRKCVRRSVTDRDIAGGLIQFSKAAVYIFRPLIRHAERKSFLRASALPSRFSRECFLINYILGVYCQ